MSAYPVETAKAAKWLYDRKEVSYDWNFRVLSKLNPDKETLGYSDIVSFHIFSILEREGLISPGIFTDKQGKPFPGFKLNLEDKKKWDKVMDPPRWWDTFILNPAIDIFTNIGKFAFWTIGVLLGAIITQLVEKWL